MPMLTSGDIYQMLDKEFKETYKADMDRILQQDDSLKRRIEGLPLSKQLEILVPLVVNNVREAMFQSISNVLYELFSRHSA